MKLRTLIIDDEPIALEKLRHYVAKVPFLEFAGEACSGYDAEHIMEHLNVDLIITDINMPDKNGMDFVKSLSHPPMVIFTTAHEEYALDSYKVAAVDFLLKPFCFDDFQRAAARAMAQWPGHRSADDQRQLPTQGDDSIFIKVDYRFIRVSLSDIRFIKGFGEYLQIYVQGESAPLLTLSSFAAIRERLSDCFIQVHRSYIVNMNHVQMIDRGRIVMDSSTSIPVGDSYKADYLLYLSTHSFGKQPTK